MKDYNVHSTYCLVLLSIENVKGWNFYVLHSEIEYLYRPMWNYVVGQSFRSVIMNFDDI